MIVDACGTPPITGVLNVLSSQKSPPNCKPRMLATRPGRLAYSNTSFVVERAYDCAVAPPAMVTWPPIARNINGAASPQMTKRQNEFDIASPVGYHKQYGRRWQSPGTEMMAGRDHSRLRSTCRLVWFFPPQPHCQGPSLPTLSDFGEGV